MTIKRAEELLLEYKQIQNELQKLSERSMTIVEELYSLNNRNTEDKAEYYKKSILNQRLADLGYVWSSSTINQNRIIILKRDNVTLKTKFLKSKYYSDGNFNAWYTINKDGLEFLDLLLLIFHSRTGDPSVLMLDRRDITSFLKSVKIPEDKRIHLKLKITADKVEEISSGIDFTHTVNNFSLLI
ncbi:hypothetical protein [Alkalibacterium thalassium]|uniref:Uncharacterized protein n=1 Tax=Alkalibacterium thalassium TaxID=426701 RepID=A0A1G9CYB6_9LACT|nr:hypothetical protein [Alkalibacterium thalassium]SDK56632.1 hypothetical protein SAMN04488098_10397 [Alkalibacterium thalassium]